MTQRPRVLMASPLYWGSPFQIGGHHFARAFVRGGYKKAVVAVAHRLCRILFAMIRDGSDFCPERIGVEEGRFTRTTSYKYRLTPKPAGRLKTIG